VYDGSSGQYLERIFDLPNVRESVLSALMYYRARTGAEGVVSLDSIGRPSDAEVRGLKTPSSGLIAASIWSRLGVQLPSQQCQSM
jgi:hypothetical protein